MSKDRVPAPDPGGEDLQGDARKASVSANSRAESGRLATSADEASHVLSFEEASRRLAEIVTELERGDLPLEHALALFEEGIKLARLAHATIERAERRVEELLGFDGDGRAVTRGLDP